MPVIILPCTCESDYQDKKYGPGRRVHNTKKGANAGANCTVCGRTNK